MPLNPSRFVPNEMKTSVLKIYSYDDKRVSGVLSNPYFEQSMYFDNIIQFVFLMDELQDSLNYPQVGMEPRSLLFGSPSNAVQTNVADRQGLEDLQPIASFKINVLFRQNASWQGTIVWLEQSSEAQFRSVLEFIMILDTVLSSTKK